MQMSELMMSSPHNFPLSLFTEMTKITWESKTCIIFSLHKCRIMFALIYFEMGTCFYMLGEKIKMFNILYTKYMEKVRRRHHQLTHLHICFVMYAQLALHTLYYPIILPFPSTLPCILYAYFHCVQTHCNTLSILCTTIKDTQLNSSIMTCLLCSLNNQTPHYMHINCSIHILLKNKTSKFHIFLKFYPIYIKFSLFCSIFCTLFIELTYTWTGFLLWHCHTYALLC